MNRPNPKFKKGDTVLVLDYSDGRDDGVYNYFWVKSYNQYIGKIMIVKEALWDDYLKETWIYRLEETAYYKDAFNEHWLAKAEFLPKELFEI